MGKQRHKGEGSVYRDASDGRWRGAVVLPDGSRRRVSGRTAREATEKLRAVQREIADGFTPLSPRLTIGEFLEHWLEHVLPNRRTTTSVNTVANYRTVARLHIVPALGKRPLKALTPEDIERALQGLADRGYSRNTAIRFRSVLVMALTHAERRGMLLRNVARLSEIPVSARPPAESRALSVEQAQALLAAAEDDPIGPMVTLGLMVGLRPGELAGLRWSDVDLDKATLQVRHQLVREPGMLRLGDPKTRRSRRGIDLPAPAVAALHRQRTLQALARSTARDAWVDHDLVFTTSVGSALDPSNLRRAFDKLCARAGIGQWRPRELRHSAASFLCAAGVPLEHVADLLGHDGTRMTGQVYRHALRPTVAAAVAPMEALFGGDGT